MKIGRWRRGDEDRKMEKRRWRREDKENKMRRRGRSGRSPWRMERRASAEPWREWGEWKRDMAGWFRDPYKGFICCPRSSLLPKLMSLLPKMLPMLPNLALMRWSLSLNFEF